MLHSEQLPILPDGAAPTVQPAEQPAAKTCKDADLSVPSPKRSRYWRSIAQMEDTEEYRAFLHREFPAGASVFDGQDLAAGEKSGVSRRRWMQIMGASAALAAAGCRWEKENIVPLTYRPEDRVPGRPQTFATAWELDGVAHPLLAQRIDGRPIKLEGNPEHPYTRGGTDVFDQGLLLSMYDPDRLDVVKKPGVSVGTDWTEAEAFLRGLGEAAKDAPETLAVLCEPTSSVLIGQLRKRIADEFPGSLWVSYSGAGGSNERVGLKAASGTALRPVYDLSQADVIVCLDADPLGIQAGSTGMIRDWASRRTPESGAMNRTYAFESGFTGTGMSADHRVGVKSSAIGSLIERLAEGGDPAIAAERKASLLDRTIAAAAADLAAAGANGVVIVGPHQPAAVHAAAAALNEQLGAVGTTVSYIEVEDAPADLDALADLADRLKKGRVKHLLILGGNPLYDAPGDLDLAAGMQAAENVVRVSMYDDETAMNAGWVLPATHPMEEWNLLRAYDGTLTTCQPLLPDRITDGRSYAEVLSTLLGDRSQSLRDLFYAALESVGVTGSQDVQGAVHTGFVAESAPKAATASFSGEGGELPTSVGDGEFEVVLTPSPQVYDGRFANNGWLQETPAPVTRTVWGNCAVIAPSTADALGVGQNEPVTIAVGDRSVSLPAYILPGQAIDSINVWLGYGRTGAGVVGGYGAGNFLEEDEDVPPVGVSVGPLKTAAQPAIITGAKVTAGGEFADEHRIVTVQDHFAIDETGLEGTAARIDMLVREGSAAAYEEEPAFAEHMGPHHPPLESLWEEWQYEDTKKWGMAIDLSKCVGCGSCVTACTAENNIPVVGPDQVDRGREMHWIRVDRYFAFGSDDPEQFDLDNPRVVSQPVACHHCETAPCEQVCPVAATVHSYEGLNDMVYNRCIGTRYCANNCPYKVRRFNFFNYNKRYESDQYDLQALVLNPEVTVRARGVMEKCTYCVQRIKGVTQYARNERRPIADGEIQTACQTACPADAIVFGDLNQPGSEVARQHANPRAYAMLAELNVKPRTQYLARIRNIHPELADLHPDLSEVGHGHHEGHGGDHGDDHHSEPGDEHHADGRADGMHSDDDRGHGGHGDDDHSHDHADEPKSDMVEAPSGKVDAPE